MFGFFSRLSRKRPEPARAPSAAAGQAKTGLPLPVVVRRSAVEDAMDEPFDLVFAVERFIQTMVSNGSALLRGKDDAKLAEAGMPELEEHFTRSAAAA